MWRSLFCRIATLLSVVTSYASFGSNLLHSARSAATLGEAALPWLNNVKYDKITLDIHNLFVYLQS